ncbi:MAG: single-stranded DNA-binding protein, partial [Planctomycetota bacterium]|nr:single-stranded DNA-binding protein [Planctomycetota bacterium]
MANLNKVMLIGNLTRDIELRAIAGGQNVGNFGLAVNRQFNTKDGQKHEETTFLDCEVWGRQADVMKQYLSKGRPVFIEGRLKLDTWEDKEGKKQSKIRVVVENFQFLGGGRREEGAGQSGN